MTLRLLAIVILVLPALGCGSDATDVTGKVSYQGKPVVFGTVCLIGSDGLPKYGAIQSDGSFRIAGARLGATNVAVSSPKPPGFKLPGENAPKTGRDEGLDERRPADADATSSPEVLKGWFPLPDKFGNPNTSELTTTVEPNQLLILELK